MAALGPLVHIPVRSVPLESGDPTQSSPRIAERAEMDLRMRFARSAISHSSSAVSAGLSELCVEYAIRSRHQTRRYATIG
jgi:hypothetical protein